MELLFLLVLIVISFIIAIFVIALKVKFVLNTNESYLNLTLIWLEPFVKILVNVENSTPAVNVYLFNQFIFKKALKEKDKKQGKTDIIRLASPSDIHVNLQYGFRDPFITGIACGAVNTVSATIGMDSISHTPDFISQNDYVYMDASAKVNIGAALVKLFKFKNRNK